LANFPSCVIQLPKISALAPHKKTFLANLIKPFLNSTSSIGYTIL
jgi:hypothetical protein